MICVLLHPVDVEIFYLIKNNFDLQVALEERSGDAQRLYIHPLVAMNVCINI